MSYNPDICWRQGITVDPLTIHDSACIGLLSELRRSVDRIWRRAEPWTV